MPTTPRKPGSFPPGHQGPRRVRGVPNRTTRELRAAIIDAAAAHGSDGAGAGQLTGYLYFLAARHPKAFTGLLGKLLPLQVSGSVQSIGQVNVVSIPMDRYLRVNEAAKLLDGVIDQPSPGHSLCNDVMRADS